MHGTLVEGNTRNHSGTCYSRIRWHETVVACTYLVSIFILAEIKTDPSDRGSKEPRSRGSKVLLLARDSDASVGAETVIDPAPAQTPTLAALIEARADATAVPAHHD